MSSVTFIGAHSKDVFLVVDVGGKGASIDVWVPEPHGCKPVRRDSLGAQVCRHGERTHGYDES
jgi:hypothetical protein